jgi:hypothetical protein
MARKKDEDEWFEDDAEAEEKPKKKKGKKSKKSWKIAIWIAVFVVILAILLLIRFKYATPAPEEKAAEEIPPPAEVEEKYVPEPDTTRYDGEEPDASTYDEPKYLGPDVVPKEDLPHVESNIDTSVEPELFSNIRCDYDATADILYMSLRVYNNIGEDIKISPRGVQKGYNTYFFIRGVVDTDPGCGTELLQPDEYTDCKRIGFDLQRYSAQPGINRISVQVPGKTEALLVECPAVPEESAINQWINKANV